MNNFPKKKIGGKWTILSPKMVHPHNFRSTVRIFLQTFLHEKVQLVDESNNNGL